MTEKDVHVKGVCKARMVFELGRHAVTVALRKTRMYSVSSTDESSLLHNILGVMFVTL